MIIDKFYHNKPVNRYHIFNLRIHRLLHNHWIGWGCKIGIVDQAWPWCDRTFIIGFWQQFGIDECIHNNGPYTL